MDWQASGELAQAQQEDRAVFLVHAEVFHVRTGWHGHAWVERVDALPATVDLYIGTLCPFPALVRNAYDFANRQQTILPIPVYYYLGQVRNPHYYTPDQAFEMLLKQRTFGPWL
jgi:hypothetical protein